MTQELERPVIHHQRRRQAKGHQVGQRVVLHAELGLRVGQARNAAIHAIEHRGHEDGNAGVLKPPLGGCNDGEKAGKHAGRGEQIGQQVDAPPPPRLL